MKRRIGSNPRKATIIKLIRSGVMPQDLPGAQAIGDGAFRIAYRVGRYVVKAASDDESYESNGKRSCHVTRTQAVRNIRRLNVSIRITDTTYVKKNGKGFVIQPYLQPMQGAPYTRYQEEIAPHLDSEGFVVCALDIHEWNVGMNNKGQLEAYDW